MPIGFCCSKCNLYDDTRTCLKTLSKRKTDVNKRTELIDLHPISTSIEDGILKVIIAQGDNQIPIYINLQLQFEKK
jgi:hypothetical protein